MVFWTGLWWLNLVSARKTTVIASYKKQSVLCITLVMLVAGSAELVAYRENVKNSFLE